MGVAEKKAMDAASEKLTLAAQKLKTSGLEAEVEIDFSSIADDQSVLDVAANVPVSIVEAMAVIAEDADYKEAMSAVTKITFAPQTSEANFDYDASASLEGGMMNIKYLPKQYMHGGYERSIKSLF